jgi:hypothetical protein
MVKRPTMDDVRVMNRRLKAAFVAEYKNGGLPPELLIMTDVLDWVTNGSRTRTVKEIEKWLTEHDQ